MKWTNKGHELDELGKKLARFDKIAIFGAGDAGRKLYKALKNEIEIVGFIDNNKSRQSEGYSGLTVYSPESFKNIASNDTMVIISVFKQEYQDEIIDCMEKLGFIYNENLLSLFDNGYYNKKCWIYMWYKKGKLFTADCTLSITDRCTLNCKNCVSFMPYIKNPADTDIAVMKNDIDLLFGAFDYIFEVGIIGGEPFLYRHLDEVIEYIGENYLKKIGFISIITNGMIVPNDKTLNAIKKYDFIVRISDYSPFLPNIKEAVNRFISVMEERNLNYAVSNVGTKWWVDIGLEKVKHDNVSDEELIELFDKCNMLCRLCKNGKYYNCAMDGYALKAGLISLDSGFELSNLDKKDKRVLLEYDFGYSEKGYTDMCRKCDGFVSINKNYVQAALQTPRL